MNDAMVLACEVAEEKLKFSWNKDALVQAIENDLVRSFGNALRILGPVLSSSVVELLEIFDRAGMSKDEMSASIWEAAGVFYEDLQEEGGQA